MSKYLDLRTSKEEGLIAIVEIKDKSLVAPTMPVKVLDHVDDNTLFAAENLVVECQAILNDKSVDSMLYLVLMDNESIPFDELVKTEDENVMHVTADTPHS